MDYQIIILPILAGLISQLIKVLIESTKGKFYWGLFNEYGGMPSSHTSFVVGLMTTVALYQGIFTTEFSVALILALIVVRDATGFRRYLGKQAELINHIVKKLSDKDQAEFIVLPERLGHTPLQVAGGAAVGILIPLLWYLLF